jgi:hypothetical protein
MELNNEARKYLQHGTTSATLLYSDIYRTISQLTNMSGVGKANKSDVRGQGKHTDIDMLK